MIPMAMSMKNAFLLTYEIIPLLNLKMLMNWNSLPTEF